MLKPIYFVHRTPQGYTQEKEEEYLRKNFATFEGLFASEKQDINNSRRCLVWTPGYSDINIASDFSKKSNLEFFVASGYSSLVLKKFSPRNLVLYHIPTNATFNLLLTIPRKITGFQEIT